MARITLIDDDFSVGILEEALRYRGHEVDRVRSADEALGKVQDIVTADLVILDIIMEWPQCLAETGVSGGRTTGMTIFREIRAKNSQVPILAYSATQDKDVIDILMADSRTKFVSKWNILNMNELIAKIEKLAGVSSISTYPKSFIVHGHDDTAKLELKNFLQNTLGLPEPIILHEQPNLDRTIIEKFEDYAIQTDIAFVLLTPDDKMSEGDETDNEKRRARQNVIFEMGFFLGKLGRQTGRVFLLHKGPLDLPSDISGIIYIDISNGIEAVAEQIRKELQSILT